jgi:hypothetical protein
MTADVAFAVDTDTNTVTLPYEYGAILKVQVDDIPRNIYGDGYEFLQFGPGNVDPTTSGLSLLIDYGDNFGTSVDVPSTAGVLKVKASDATDTDAVRIQGLDANGDPIFDSFGVPGEEVVPSVAGTNTTNTFSKVTGFSKPLTKGTIQVLHVFPVTLVELPLQTFMPWELKPQYRRYGVAQSGATSIRALCSLRYIPLQMEDQYMVPGNLGAIKNSLMAVNYENNNDLERSEIYWGKAYAILNDELKSYRGGVQTIPNIAPYGVGMGNIKQIV